MDVRARGAVLAAAAGATAASGLAVMPAPAAADETTCDANEWCVWSGEFGGAFDQVAEANLASDPDLSNNTYDTDTSRTQGNTISSVHNRTDYYIALYNGTSYSGLLACIGPNSAAYDMPPSIGDLTSSYRRVSPGQEFDKYCVL